MPERVLFRPGSIRQRLVHDRDKIRMDVIVIIEVAALQHAEFRMWRSSRERYAMIGVSLPLRGSAVLTPSGKVVRWILPLKGSVSVMLASAIMGSARSRSSKFLLELLGSRLWIMFGSQVQIQHQFVRDFKSRVGLLRVAQAVNEKPGADQRDQRKSDLQHHQRAAQARTIVCCRLERPCGRGAQSIGSALKLATRGQAQKGAWPPWRAQE